MLDHDEIQAALSARVDGESYTLRDDVIDAHVEGCAQCAQFQQQALALSRTMAGESLHHGMAPPVDLAESILAGVEPEWRAVSSARQTSLAVARIGLVGMGLLCMLWAVTMIVGAAGLVPWSDPQTLAPEADPLQARLLMEGAAFRAGLGVALFFAAWRPELVAGILPVVTPAFMFLAGFAMRDTVLGLLGREQMYTLLGLGLTCVLLVWTWMVDKGFVFRAAWKQLTADPV